MGNRQTGREEKGGCQDGLVWIRTTWGPGGRTPIMAEKGPDEDYKYIPWDYGWKVVQMRIKMDAIGLGLGYGW